MNNNKNNKSGSSSTALLILCTVTTLGIPSISQSNETLITSQSLVGAGGGSPNGMFNASMWNHAFLQFNLADLGEIDSAKLVLHSLDDASLKTTAWQASSDDWGSTGGTPNAVGYPWYSTEIAGETEHTQGNVTIDVTDFIRQESSGDGIASFELSNNGFFWYPYSSDSDLAPRLVISSNQVSNAPNTQPEAIITAAVTQGTAPLSLSFDALSSSDSDGEISAYHWDFGDGSFDDTASTQHTFVNAGDYTVLLTVTDNAGDNATQEITVTVDEADDNSGPTEQKITELLPTDDLGAADIGEGMLLATSQWDHSFFRFDLKDISDLTFARLRIYSHQSTEFETQVWAASSDQWEEFVNRPNATGFSWYGSEPIAVGKNTFGYQEYDVTNFVRAELLKDGISSFEFTNTRDDYQYFASRESAHPPQLIIGHSDNATANNSPIANIQISHNSDMPLMVTFDGSESLDEDGYIFGYDWDFGDGNTANSVNPEHTYRAAGTYPITLTVLDNDGATTTTSTTVTVKAGVNNQPPVADFNVSTGGAEAPLSISLDASNASDAEGDITHYQWRFSDGNTTTGKTTEHTFNDAGRYLVTLVVTDEAGLESTAVTTTVVLTTDEGKTSNNEIIEEINQSIYFIGNSVTDGVRYDTFASLAESADKTLAWGRHMIPGAPLEWTWNHPNGGITEKPYGNYQTALSEHSWKSLSLQPFDRDLAVDVDYASRYMQLALNTNPNTQVYILAYYPRLNQGDWEEQWLGNSTVRTSRTFFTTLANQLSAEFPQAPAVKLFPVGEVMYRLKQKIDAGEITGLSTITDLYEDNVHLNDAGEFIVAMTVYATLYKTDPLGLSASAYGLSAELATTIQQIAWKVVQEQLSAD